MRWVTTMANNNIGVEAYVPASPKSVDRCEYRRVNEQYHCHRCGLQWDIDEPIPGGCKANANLRAAEATLRELKDSFEK